MPRFYTNLEKENTSGLFQKIYEWQAPERQWTPKTRTWYVVYSFFFISLIFIAAILQEFVFIVAIIAFTFLWFIQGSIAPQITTHMITSIGIRAFEKLYKWTNIKHFWISKKDETLFLNLEVVEDENPDYVKRIPLILNEGEDHKIFDLLIKYVDYGDKEEISYNFLTPFLTGKYIDISNFMVVDEDSLNELS